ncbi:MAG: DbpA RNA binding domain-containing protein, partial [Gemmatimonadales bacterium]
PTRSEMQALAAIAGPVALVLASQLAYLRSIASVTPLSLPSAADHAQDRAAALRARIASRLAEGDIDAELTLLEPLFERYDPAEVAGALLAIRRPSAVVSEDVAPPPPPAAGQWVKLFVNVGRKDGAAPKDLVGALIREVGLDKAQIGRIEMKDAFSLVDVAPAIAEQAARRLTGVSIRGKRVTARLDRAG